MNQYKRTTVRVPLPLDHRVENYTKQYNMTKNELFVEAMTFYLDVKDGLVDFDQPALQRLNQVIDGLQGVSLRQDETQKMLSDFMAAFMRQVSGENYFLD